MYRRVHVSTPFKKIDNEKKNVFLVWEHFFIYWLLLSVYVLYNVSFILS